MKKKKAFTLIELIAVLVILAILALIVTPLVMNIIKKARISADKRSIDAYGRSIEIAIAGYLLDNGTFPTSIGQLTIEYSGDEVVCSTTQLNGDSSVYLAGCTVGGRSVDYTYGEDKTPAPTYTAYTVGDEVRYNNVDYYVIKNSSENEDTVTLLKAEPLTVAEVNLYGGVGTANNHVNNYVGGTEEPYYQTACDRNGYGGMQYYSSATCDGSSGGTSGCVTDYAQSEIKHVVDAYAVDKVPDGLVTARLLAWEDFENLGYVESEMAPSVITWVTTENTPTWLHGYKFWTMTPKSGSNTSIWDVDSDGSLHYGSEYGYNDTVRPVIVLSKAVL